MTPIEAIRKTCLACMGGSYTEVAECVETECPLFAYRFGKRPTHGRYSPLSAIRARCLYCLETSQAVSECASHDNKLGSGYDNCPIYPYRFGRNPKLKNKRGKGFSAEAMLKGRKIANQRRKEIQEAASTLQLV